MKSERTATPIRVLLVDDHQMVRQGLLFFLSTQPDIEVIGEAPDGVEAVRMAHRLQPDVVLMDLVLPKKDGLEAACDILSTREEIAILVLTSYIDDGRVIEAIRCGVSGYLMKDVNPTELARAIRAAARGEVYLDKTAAKQLAASLRPDSSGPDEPSPDVLTGREMEVLALVARGLSNQDIALQLSLSVPTIKGYVSSILAKLGLSSRVQAALYALRREIVDLDEL